jgi:hypothetical protein
MDILKEHKAQIDAIRSLLAELHYVWETADVRDSFRNSEHLRKDSAKLLGFESWAEFVDSISED